ncbi:structure-specific endonuclease subunit SLX1 homolog isoform X1 [Episyrphus balteatus]|uniref:structure-specific endonuclease subunit SLX1 homolog isoform X1 n=1 Tax=Episyrphus balteatus TaxID=286459 RepID=UPI0024859A4C|nr:structure-specific endonuclease subunit SLX1 homolog isoform X1 [Episyrphus balteatus]
MESNEIIKSDFYGVYLLCSDSAEKKYNGKCYIGYTVNPNRRINQHNRGRDFGGAKKTSNKGPWRMILIVYGFPNNISALQFEWAWQQPTQSSRLKHYLELKRKNNKESFLQYNFRILSVMLDIGPWNRLPVTIRWLETDKVMEFRPQPPKHMKIISGKIKIGKQNKNTAEELQTHLWALECHLCMKPIDNPERSRIGCLNAKCKLTCHIVCMAEHMLTLNESHKGHYIPIDGECPMCGETLTWVDLLKNRNNSVPEEIEIDFEDLADIDDDDVN